MSGYWLDIALVGILVVLLGGGELAVLGGSWLLGVAAVIAIAAVFLRVGYDEDVDRAGAERRRGSRRLQPPSPPRA